MKNVGGRAKRWVVFGISFLVTIEIAARVEQWLEYGAPILDEYTYSSALFMNDEHGIRGKPNGHYEKWKLNSYGFRGPEVQLESVAGRLRIICVGASETFGFYETAGKEWPRQLEALLRQSGVDAEVVNAAMAGMSLPQRIRHLEKRLLRFSPDVVVFMLEYGSYAGLTAEKVRVQREHPSVLPDPKGIVEGIKSLRTTGRLQDIVLPKLPAPIQAAIGNVGRTLKLEMRKRELGSKYRSYVHVMPFEVEAFTHDLEELSTVASAAGVTVVFLSPAMWFTDRNLSITYLSWPFLDESWWREAQDALSKVAREFAVQRDIDYIDLFELVRGHEHEWMTDMLHFNDRGAEQVAKRVAEQIMKQRNRAAD